MVPLVADSLSGLVGERCGSSEPFVVTEVPAAEGVPDLVAVVWDQEAVDNRMAANLTPVEDLTSVRVLIAASSGIDSIRGLAAKSGVTASHLRRNILPVLFESRWMQPAEAQGKIKICSKYRCVAELLVTVEAKKANWNRALKQAMRHASGADYAYVALDEARATAAKSFASEFSALGVGLLTAHAGSGLVQAVTHPIKQWVDEAARAVLAERIWALKLAGRESGPTFPVFGKDLSGPSLTDG
jgi:hypothetical protein